MARRRFFVTEIRRGKAELLGEDAEHLVRVLRAEVGQVYEISDNRHLYLATITTARKSLVEFEVTATLPSERVGLRLLLVAALIKFDRFELMLEKATELGVSEIIPFTADRSEQGLAKAAAKRKVRWERIALEGSQQSRRLQLPVIRETGGFRQATEVEAEVKLFLDEESGGQSILQCLPPISRQGVALLVGPEGGWTDASGSAH